MTKVLRDRVRQLEAELAEHKQHAGELVVRVDRLQEAAESREGEVTRLTACLAKANANHEHFEREWYLRGDEVGELRTAIVDILASATPNERDHPCMSRSWARAQAVLDRARRDAEPGALRPMSEAPMSGPMMDILVAMVDRHGNRRWTISHYAFGGGEDQPPFRGWFFWTGHGYAQLDAHGMLGWLPLPQVPR